MNEGKSLSCVQLFATPWTPWNSPGQNTGLGSLALLQGIFPTQGSNPGLPPCRQILYPNTKVFFLKRKSTFDVTEPHVIPETRDPSLTTGNASNKSYLRDLLENT